MIVQAERHLPDAAIFDMDSTTIDGRKASRCLRAHLGERRPLIAAITGGDSNEVTLSGLFDHVLKRPIDMKKLVKIFDQL